MKKNVASQVIGAQMVSATDGAEFTGTVTVYVTGDAGTQGLGSVGSGVCTHEGHGFHTYLPAQAETNYDHIAFTFIGTGAVPATVQLYTEFPQTGDAFARLGAPAGASVSADVAAVKTDTAAIKVQTDKLTFTVANQIDANVLDWKSATAPAMTGDAFARLGAPAGASVSADVAAVKAVDDAIKTKTDSLTFTVAGMIDSNVVDWKGATAPAMTGDAFARLGAPAGASVSADVAAIKVDTAAIKAKTDNLPSDPADASDIATAFGTVNSSLGTLQTSVDDLPTNAELATALGTADDAVLAQVALVKAKTDNLPSDPADASDIAGAFGVVNSSLGTLSTAIDALPTNAELATALGTADDAVLAAISGLTIPTAAAVADAVWDEAIAGHAGAGSTGEALADAAAGGGSSGPTAIEIADEVLTRQFGDVDDSGGDRDLLHASRFIRNGFSISGATLTVLKEDDTTPAYTRTLTTDAGAVPIVGVD